jgi:hypothetical protein
MSLNRIYRLSVLVAMGILSGHMALAYSGVAYEQGSNKSKKLFTYENQSETMPDGTLKITGLFKDISGKVLVQEVSILKGNDVVSYEIDHAQTGRKGKITVSGSEVSFSKTEKNGDQKSDSEKLKKSLVISSTFVKFVGSQWASIMSGKEVDVRYGVWDRAETVGFTISKTGEEKRGSEVLMKLKMEPTSFVIKALVKPIHFLFSADGTKLVEMNGRVSPKRADGGDFKDLDAEVVYTY